MTYQVLARKWRPQDFSSLVGQEPIVTALRNGLRENRIAQAYLFSGIRGVGKTTAARVLAKALNCRGGENPERPSPDPCNECDPCRDITTGHDMDVLEVDAATYSKVEQIRELTESLRYGTANDRYKVVVLDEVHRLSRQAFDALLKIVEEPPPHLVFIFATTESDAVPATILSRCQEFQFRRVPSAVLAEHLRRISDAEAIEVSDPALRLIARAGEGSVRDSVALLDQLATFGNSKISDQDAKNLLGGLDAAIFLRLLGSILSGEHSAITEIVQEVEANGWDPHNVYSQFLVFTRDALHLAMGGATDQIDLPKEEAAALGQLVTSSSYENLLSLCHLLLSSESTVHRSEFGGLALEIAWLRAAELPKITKIEDLLSGRTPPPAALPELPSPQATIARTSPGAARIERAVGTAKVSPSTLENPDPAEFKPPTPRGGSELLPAFLRELGSRRPSLAPLIKRAQPDFKSGTIYLAMGDPQISKALDRPGNRETFEQLLSEIWGPGIAWDWYEPAKKETTSTDISESPALGAASSPLQEISQNPTVKAVLDVFGGKIQSIHSKETPSS
jgi:DNA polymerase-3 subunit gamma/tau